MNTILFLRIGNFDLTEIRIKKDISSGQYIGIHKDVAIAFGNTLCLLWVGLFSKEEKLCSYMKSYKMG